MDVLVDVPCFKCLLWNPIMASHLHCNPNDCEALTEWLLKQVENLQPKNHVTIADMTTGLVKEPAAKHR